MNDLTRFRTFVQILTKLVDRAGDDEPRIFKEGRELLADLVSHDDWLPEEFAGPHPDHYQQYLLHCDPLERVSVVSFVWGPGQETPIHDHTVWGMVGVMRGGEVCKEYTKTGESESLVAGKAYRLLPGQVEMVSPRIGDIHQVANAFADRVSLSVHVYGANIGVVRRHIYDPTTGLAHPYISGYSNRFLPNLWNAPSPSH